MKLFNRLVITFLPLIPKAIVGLVSKPYVAGPRLEQAIDAVKKLNQAGMCATLDVLGESTLDPGLCDEAVTDYHRVLEAIREQGLDCNISIKLTQLGLRISPELCFQNARKIVEKANAYSIFVRVDMEDASVTTATIDLFVRLHAEFPRTGIVLQACLRRSLHDLKKLAADKINFRLCKGIYIEPRAVAYQDPRIVNDNFALLLETALQAGSYVGIATHDEKMVWQGLSIVHRLNLKPEQYEFQMLLGVDEELRDIVAASGHKLRVYVPFGRRWYAYCVRRLKENPQIALYVIKAMFGIK